MTKDDFYRKIHESIEEEYEDAAKYIELAKDAMNEEDMECLMEIAKQEVMHRAKLEWIYLKKDI